MWPRLLTLEDAAEMIGLSAPTLRSLHSGKSPPATRVGRRVYFATADLDSWLEAQREQRPDQVRPRRGSFLPGRIGSGVPTSSEPAKRTWCKGSHTEPMAASPYMGRAICRECGDAVLVNRDGRRRKHYPRWW